MPQVLPSVQVSFRSLTNTHFGKFAPIIEPAAQCIPSKVNAGKLRVPKTALTVTHSPALADAPVPGLHATVVLDVHADVLHSSSMIACAVGVLATAPKLSPEIVTEMPADNGVFVLGSKLAVGKSKLHTGMPVPATAPTVTTLHPKMSTTGFNKHATVVAELHDDVKHTPRSPPPPRSSPAVAVCSPIPKLSPVTVTDA